MGVAAIDIAAPHRSAWINNVAMAGSRFNASRWLLPFGTLHARRCFWRCGISARKQKGRTVIKWAIMFLVISVIAGFFGFTGVASGARTIAKVLFFVAIIAFLIVLVFGVFLGKLVF
jgi:uncharacterized membrane protein YtjA (UPF0391 family)